MTHPKTPDSEPTPPPGDRLRDRYPVRPDERLPLTVKRPPVLPPLDDSASGRVGEHGSPSRRPHPDESLLPPMPLPPELPPDDEYADRYGPPPLCTAINPETGHLCVLLDLPGPHRTGHRDLLGREWLGDGEDFLRWVRQPLDVEETAPPIEAHVTVPEEAFGEMLADLDTPARRNARLRETMDHVIRSAPFQYMTGSWAEAIGRSDLSNPLIEEAKRLSRSHWAQDESGPVRVAHTGDPVTGCAYCIRGERSDRAIAMQRSLSPGDRFVLPHVVLYVLAVDDLARERS